MDPAAFFAEALPWARLASSQTRVPVSVILAQWADETDFGGPDWSPRNNPGNVGDTQAGGQVVYPTLGAGVAAYVETMHLSYYAAVPVPPASSAHASAVALGESPWAAGHYDNGGGPGSALVAIVDTYNLEQYDQASEAEMTGYESGGQRHVFVWENGKCIHWWQGIQPSTPWQVEVLPAPPA